MRGRQDKEGEEENLQQMSINLWLHTVTVRFLLDDTSGMLGLHFSESIMWNV